MVEVQPCAMHSALFLMKHYFRNIRLNFSDKTQQVGFYMREKAMFMLKINLFEWPPKVTRLFKPIGNSEIGDLFLLHGEHFYQIGVSRCERFHDNCLIELLELKLQQLNLFYLTKLLFCFYERVFSLISKNLLLHKSYL